MVHTPCVLFATVALSFYSALSAPIAREFNVLEARVEPDPPGSHRRPPSSLPLSPIGLPPRSTLHLSDSFHPLYWPADAPPIFSANTLALAPASVLALAPAGTFATRPAKRVADNVPEGRKTLPPNVRQYPPLHANNYGSPFPARPGPHPNAPTSGSSRPHLDLDLSLRPPGAGPSSG